VTVASIPFSPSLSERVCDLLRRCEYRLVETPSDREPVYRMRYASYLREGAITASDSGRLSDRYDETDNARLFAVYVGGRLASSIRLHVVSGRQPISPAVEVFPHAILPHLQAGRTLLDPSRFVADFEMARAHPELVYVTLRLPFMAADYFAADLALATVRDEHRAFYRRVLRYGVACDARPYPTLVKPLGLMMADFPAERDGVLRRFPFFAPKRGELARVFGRDPRLVPGRGTGGMVFDASQMGGDGGAITQQSSTRRAQEGWALSSNAQPKSTS
jgi:hypothetical protein